MFGCGPYRAPDPMAIPPAYCDLGKAARDVFNKGYGFGMVKLELKTKSSTGVEFTTSGSSNTDTGKASGSLETKYKFKDYGLTFTQKWNTDNTMGTELIMEDKLAEGLKLNLETTFVPNTGSVFLDLEDIPEGLRRWIDACPSSHKIQALQVLANFAELQSLGGNWAVLYGYYCPFGPDFNPSGGCNVDIDLSGPTIHGWAVLGYEGWLAGYQMAFDTAKSKLSQNNFALGYKAADFQLHTSVNDGTEFGGSVYQKVSDKIETSVSLAWTAGSNNTRFGIATKYKLDDKASVSAKVNNASLIGLGYTQTLRPGVKLTLSSLIDGKNFSTGGHKIGLGFELEA